MKKEQKQYFAFIVLFLMIIFATPLLQAIVEYRKDKTIQAFDIFADAIVTPFNRAVRLHDFAIKLFRTTDSLEQVMEGMH